MASDAGTAIAKVNIEMHLNHVCSRPNDGWSFTDWLLVEPMFICLWVSYANTLYQDYLFRLISNRLNALRCNETRIKFTRRQNLWDRLFRLTLSVHVHVSKRQTWSNAEKSQYLPPVSRNKKRNITCNKREKSSGMVGGKTWPDGVRFGLNVTEKLPITGKNK